MIKMAVNLRVRDLIECGEKEGKTLKEILEKKRFCRTMDTSIFYLGIYDEQREEIKGSRIEEDGDHHKWGPVKLSEILDYYDIETISFNLQRRPYHSTNPRWEVDSGD